MKNEKYFNKKTTIVSFILYILITAFILVSSLIEGDTSGKQSDFVSNAISSTVAFLSGDNLNLNNDGKHEELYPKSLEATIDSDEELMLGKTYKVGYTLSPKGEYGLKKISYASSDESVLKIDNEGVLEMINQGTATITVKDGFSGLTSELNLTVGSGVYTPQIDLKDVGEAKYYYSNSNGASALYYLDYSAPLPPAQLEAYTNTPEYLDVALDGGKVFFVPKALGEFKIFLKGVYLNVNGVSHVTTEKTITVLDKVMPLNTFTVNPVSLNLKTGETASLNVDGNFFPTSKNGLVTLDKTDLGLNITATRKGSDVINIYTVKENTLVKTEIDLSVTQGVPIGAKILSPTDYVHIDYGLELHVSVNGKLFPRADFDWAVTGNATVDDGIVKGDKHGKVTVTATHKENPEFTLSRTYVVRYNYSYYVRKLVGHFLLFTLLAIFAVVVYYRLAEILTSKHKTLISIILILVAGALTAGLSEILQLEAFSVNRTANFADFLLDFAGYLVGAVVVFAITVIKNNRNKKRP